MISYQSSWAYLAKAYGLEVVEYVEPRPGIEPTVSHNSELIDFMKKRNVRAV